LCKAAIHKQFRSKGDEKMLPVHLRFVGALNIATADRGCVEDQPQRMANSKVSLAGCAATGIPEPM